MALNPSARAVLGSSLAYRRTMKTLAEAIKDDHKEVSAHRSFRGTVDLISQGSVDVRVPRAV